MALIIVALLAFPADKLVIVLCKNIFGGEGLIHTMFRSLYCGFCTRSSRFPNLIVRSPRSPSFYTQTVADILLWPHSLLQTHTAHVCNTTIWKWKKELPGPSSVQRVWSLMWAEFIGQISYPYHRIKSLPSSSCNWIWFVRTHVSLRWPMPVLLLTCMCAEIFFLSLGH